MKASTIVANDKLWNVIRGLDREALIVLLARALKEVPQEAVEALFVDHVHPEKLRGPNSRVEEALLCAVEEFCQAARKGDYFEDFFVDSQTFRMKSAKTEEFGARLSLFLDRCVADATMGDPQEVCDSYDALLDLLREIDRFERDNIIFWADEGGIWQLGINWMRVLPPYFRCLNRTLNAQAFQEKANAVIDEFASLEGKKLRAMIEA